jgi:hypothetical protein
MDTSMRLFCDGTSGDSGVNSCGQSPGYELPGPRIDFQQLVLEFIPGFSIRAFVKPVIQCVDS